MSCAKMIVNTYYNTGILYKLLLLTPWRFDSCKIILKEWLLKAALVSFLGEISFVHILIHLIMAACSSLFLSLTEDIWVKNNSKSIERNACWRIISLNKLKALYWNTNSLSMDHFIHFYDGNHYTTCISIYIIIID